MSLRAAVAAGLALLTLSSVAPVGAVVLCVSNDGCAALETVQGWTTRCVESHCDDAHRAAGTGEDEHGCTDVPVLQHALPSAPLAPPALLPALLPTVTTYQAPPACGAALQQAPPALALHAAGDRHSVVLLL